MATPGAYSGDTSGEGPSVRPAAAAGPAGRTRSKSPMKQTMRDLVAEAGTTARLPWRVSSAASAGRAHLVPSSEPSPSRRPSRDLQPDPQLSTVAERRSPGPAGERSLQDNTWQRLEGSSAKRYSVKFATTSTKGQANCGIFWRCHLPMFISRPHGLSPVPPARSLLVPRDPGCPYR